MSTQPSKNPAIETLSGVDGAFLDLETAATPMHVGSLHLFATPADYRGNFHAAVRRMMEVRMVPMLRRRLATLPLHLANPGWVQGEIDLDQHVLRVRLPAPGTWAQLEATVAELHGELLDRSRPLWMIYVLDGLASGEKAYYFKIHHAMLDGHAGMALAHALFDTSAEASVVKPLRRSRGQEAEAGPGSLALAASAVRHDAAQYLGLVRRLPGLVSTLTGILRGSRARARGVVGAEDAPDLAELRRSLSFGPRTPLNVAITGERGFATAAVARADLKRIATANEATVNDVVLALCSGALRRYLKRAGALPRKSLIAAMAISLRAPGNTDFRTQAALSPVSLATQIADPLQRLWAIRDSAAATKAMARQARSLIPTDVPLLGAPWLLGTLAALYSRPRVLKALPILANVFVSNVPGPPVPLYVDGLRMSGYWPLSIVEHGVGLNITLIDYAGMLEVGFVVARCAVPDARRLADDFLDACAELEQAMQPPAKPAVSVGAVRRRKPPAGLAA